MALSLFFATGRRVCVEMSRDLGTSHVLLRFLRCVEKTECVCCGAVGALDVR